MFQGVLEGLAHYWHTMANKTQLPYYLPPERFRYDDEQSFFFTIRRLYPEAIEELAVNTHPIFREAAERYERDNQDTEKFDRVRDSIRAWQQKYNLEHDWVHKRAREVLENWYAAEQQGRPLLERRETTIFGVSNGPPAFLGDLKRFSFEYPEFAYGFNEAKVRKEVTSQFKRELKDWLVRVKKAYKDNGWRQDKEQPERQRNFEIIVHHIVGRLKPKDIADKLTLESNSGIMLRDQDVDKAISIMKKRLKPLK